MKKIIIFIIAALALVSCDNTKDYVLNNINNAPELKIEGGSNNGKEFRDSVKLALKSRMTSSKILLKARDVNSNLKQLTYKVISGTVTVKGLPANISAAPSQEYSLSYEVTLEPKDLGMNVVEFTLTDDFGAEQSVIVYLTGFNNVPPVAYINAIKDNSIQNAGLNYVLDASASYDQDYKFGGGIKLYEYTVNGTRVTWEKNKINYVFPSPGNYTVTLRVADGDDAWSNQYSNTFEIK